MMCWDMTVPEDWLCSLTLMAPKVVGATCLTKFRPITGLCAMRKSLGLCVAHVTPPTAIRECADGVCAEDTCRCWTVLVVASCRNVERMAERNCGGTIGRKASSGLQGNETARCEHVPDGTDCCNLEWKLHESALGNGLVEQSADEQRAASRSAGISSHYHTDHGNWCCEI